jgi:hypothetical protein
MDDDEETVCFGLFRKKKAELSQQSVLSVMQDVLDAGKSAHPSFVLFFKFFLQLAIAKCSWVSKQLCVFVLLLTQSSQILVGRARGAARSCTVASGRQLENG